MWTISCQIISVICLHVITSCTKSRLEITIDFTCNPTRTSGARSVVRHHIPELLNKFPPHLVDRFKTHSLYSVSHHIKCYLMDLYSYDCDEIDWYICNNNWERKSVIGWPGCCGNPLITDYGPGGRNNNLTSEHWHGVIRRDRVSISLMHRSDNFLDFRRWPHWRLSKW